jgi:D-alanyl-D-alanine carboxypeptidase/D-alanyl-D-alanine-endopeptidase (penicillin-binding protein 4)
VSDVQPPPSRRAAREAASTARMPATPPPTGLPPAAGGDSGGGTGGTPRGRRGLIIGAIVVVFALLATGAVYLGVTVGRNSPVLAGSQQDNSPTRPVPGSEIQPTPIPTCSLDSLANSASLIKLYGSVVDTASGSSLYGFGDATGVRPAGVLKILTAAAAISALGPSFQITTSVDAGTSPGTIVLVGQGDATLSRLPAGQSVYAGAPTLATLASKTLAAYNAIPANFGIPIQSIVLDSTYWNPSDNWDSSVPMTERTGGLLSETTALQVDGDRANAHLQVSPRSSDPVTAAGNAFVNALGLNPSTVTLTKGAAPSGATVLATVQSQPVSTLVRQMLQQSDDTLAEMLARIISVKENLGGASSSIQDAITTALQKYGVSTSQLTIEDGSGTSDESQIPPVFMSQLMSLISQKTNGLQYVAAGLSVSGKTGDLVGRFKGSSSIAVGKISGLAGSLPDAYTLTGYLTAADGTGESFTFFAEGDGITSAASPVLDSLAAAVYTCGKNITDN